MNKTSVLDLFVVNQEYEDEDDKFQNENICEIKSVFISDFAYHEGQGQSCLDLLRGFC